MSFLIPHRKISVFATPVMSFHIHNKHPLLMDIRILQGTQKIIAAFSTLFSQ